jgi:hypothetical protein
MFPLALTSRDLSKRFKTELMEFMKRAGRFKDEVINVTNVPRLAPS